MVDGRHLWTPPVKTVMTGVMKAKVPRLPWRAARKETGYKRGTVPAFYIFVDADMSHALQIADSSVMELRIIWLPIFLNALACPHFKFSF